jgi:hypothetical protein
MLEWVRNKSEHTQNDLITEFTSSNITKILIIFNIKFFCFFLLFQIYFVILPK